MIFLDNNCV